MIITEDGARIILEKYLNAKARKESFITLPIVDEIVFQCSDEHGGIDMWTFKGLLMVAYNLTDEK